MPRYFLFAIMLLPLATAAAVSEQTPSFDPGSGSYAFSSDESSGGTSYLGVDTRDITHDRVAELKLKDETGVEVTLVDQDAPAGKAGIKEHDVILTVNGDKVESVEQLRRMIREIPGGRAVNIGLSRDGQLMNLQVRLGTRHSTSFSIKIPPIPPVPPMPRMPVMPEMDFPMSVVVVHSAMRSGLMVENLTPQLGEFFGAKNGEGVLVRSVEKGSQAEKAGFRAGDVIVRVDKDPVHDTGDFSHALRGHRGEPVRVGIIRDKKEQTLTLSLPERRQSGEVFEESFDFPDIDIQADLHLDELKTELARVQPQLELAMKEASRSLDHIGKQLCDQQRQLHQQQKTMQKQMRQESLKLRREWRGQQRELERELQELRRSVTEI